ncbi:multidrug efflux MFS transporter MdtM [Citrobacter sp. RHBSTW-00678]|jgi:MFS family permease|uniref:Multidrug resistance protein MdtM n=3 Tax=Enterobacteriaceae TaxID=543 RepID=A0AA44LF41_CITBR|nr:MULTISPECIES: multidrug efflux MFS transporter MdtM [Citrobacter]MDU5156090.1 multidrug efflux MFS transporter MdtM [Citrobacter sp.]AUV24686.1 MFS transporter [Citrobacter freundii complex sp. CFNIH3]MBA7756980.1 multidrug efflux MFS transporter MdtM [Citrobacter sp. RHBSTW-00325]MBA8060015.1 multidrug efflux MFS transporter MdtM [Citrobacter sp. RHBSTW-00104]MBJ9028486.1 multidrug efflux MFS transporter MdtM [Citrobacter braakii]
MQRILAFFSQRTTTLFFPVALILYDFAAYLSTDLIQPGIINVVRDFNADVSLAPAAVSLYLAGGMALQWLLGPLSDRIGRRPVLIAGALIFTLACAATLLTTSMTQFLVARFVQGTSICFIATVGYVTVQEAFGQTKAIKLMAIITSIVLVAPVIGPLSGAALMHFVHWKVLFAIIAAMGLIALIGLALAMPETVKRGAVPFSARGVLRDFRDVFRNRVFLFGAATLSLSYIPMMSWVAVSPVILIDAGGMSTSEFAWAQAPVFGAVIVANMVVVRFVKDPTQPRFIWRAAPIQLSGLAVLIAGNLLWPHVWLWSVLGTSLYAFGIGMIFPTLFRFTLFSNNLPKGTVSASLNMVILTVMAVSVEIGRWLWFNGGRISFHLLAVAAGITVVFTLAGLLKRVRQHETTTLATEN